MPLAQAIATNDPPQVRPVSSSRVRAERAHKSESAPFLGLFKMFKISTLRPLQFFAEHKFSQVAGEVFGARNRLNTRRTTPRPIHSKFKKFSRGTTPTARGVCFWAPGGRRHALGALRHERTHCRRAHRQQRGRFPPFSFVHPLFVLCATSTRRPIPHPRNTRNETHGRTPNARRNTLSVVSLSSRTAPPSSARGRGYLARLPLANRRQGRA